MFQYRMAENPLCFPSTRIFPESLIAENNAEFHLEIGGTPGFHADNSVWSFYAEISCSVHHNGWFNTTLEIGFGSGLPHTSRERNILTDALDVIESIMESEVSLVLGGHKHVPWVWKPNGVIIFHTGSFGSRRAPVENTYNIVEITEEKIDIERVYNMSGKKERPLGNQVV